MPGSRLRNAAAVRAEFVPGVVPDGFSGEPLALGTGELLGSPPASDEEVAEHAAVTTPVTAMSARRTRGYHFMPAAPRGSPGGALGGAGRRGCRAWRRW